MSDAAVVFATSLICTGTTLALGNQLFGWFRVSTPSGWFKVETAKSKAPATRGLLAYVAGQTLFRPNKPPQRLAYQPTGGLKRHPLGSSSPARRDRPHPTGRSRRQSPPSLSGQASIRPPFSLC